MEWTPIHIAIIIFQMVVIVDSWRTHRRLMATEKRLDKLESRVFNRTSDLVKGTLEKDYSIILEARRDKPTRTYFPSTIGKTKAECERCNKVIDCEKDEKISMIDSKLSSSNKGEYAFFFDFIFCSWNCLAYWVRHNVQYIPEMDDE